MNIVRVKSSGELESSTIYFKLEISVPNLSRQIFHFKEKPTNQTHAIAVNTTTKNVGTGHPKDQLIWKSGVPRNHLIVEECVIIRIAMSFLAFCLGGHVFVVFLMGEVNQICVAITVAEKTVNRNENGSGVYWKDISNICAYVGVCPPNCIFWC